MPRPELHWRK